MAKREKMGVDELEQLVVHLKETAIGSESSELEAEREKALDYYYGRPFGNEVEGRSAVVDRTLMDTVEWLMPQIMRVFATADPLVTFDPQGPDDEPRANQETDATNHVFFKENDGFITLHDLVKDALLMRNGYVKSWWDECEQIRIERYKGITLQGLTSLIETLEGEEAEVEIVEKLDREIQLPAEFGGGMETVWDCKLKVKRKVGKVRVEAVPAEEVLVSQRCRGSLQRTNFVAHWTLKPRTDLIEMGMDEDFVYSLPAYNRREKDTTELSRNPLVSEGQSTDIFADDSMDEVEYLEAYVRVDFDGDGVAELRKVVLAGMKLPPGAEWYDEIEEVPLSYGVPIRMPHRHLGISIYDLVNDIQLIRSSIERAMVDNTNMTNNQRPIFNERVKWEDVAVSAPGAGIRVEGSAPVGDSLFFWSPNPILNQILPVLDYFENKKERRTGVGQNNTMMDQEVLKETAKESVMIAQNAANARIEMIVRMFSESIKDVFIRIHNLMVRHQDKAKMMKLRGEWVEVDPREWDERNDVSVGVGLGLGSIEENRQNMILLGTLQQQAAAAGIVLPHNAYALATDIANSLRKGSGSKYFTDPTQPPPQYMQARMQPPPDPYIEGEKIKAQTKMAQIQADAQDKQVERQIQAQSDARQAEIDAANLRLKKRQQDVDIAKAEVQALEAGMSIDLGRPGVGTELNQGPVQ